MVLGGWYRGLGALSPSDGDGAAEAGDLDWYHGPPGWRLHDLPDSLDGFITMATGRLFTRA
jgi:hypothetical protein